MFVVAYGCDYMIRSDYKIMRYGLRFLMCTEKTIVYNRITQSRRLHPPDILESEWCDFRRDFESGMTLKMIAEKYVCDPRTVRKCIMNNKSSSEIGKQSEPTKLAAYVEQVDSMYQDFIIMQQTSYKKLGICDISRKITKILAEEGYTGSERTVRNYLRNTYQIVTEPDEPWEEI